MINKTEYFYGIDFLRWLAAFGVVVYHYLLHFQISEIQYSSFLNYLIINKEFAPKFVWLFWTISGFVFTNIYISKNINLKKFFISRFARLYPLHFLTLVLVAILQTLSNYFFSHTQENYINDFYHFFLHVFFASDWGFQDGWSYNTPVWSVSIEIPIYFLFFFSLFFLKKYNFLFPILLVSFFYYLLPNFIDFIKTEDFITFNKWQNLAFFNFITCIFYFFLGSFIFFFIKRFIKFYKLLFFLSLISIFASIFLLNIEKTDFIFIKSIFPSTVNLFISLIIFFVTIDKIFLNLFKKIILFSNTSYSIYLIHFPLQLIILIFFEKYLLDLSIFKNIFVFLIFFITLQIISFFSFIYFETPIRKYINFYSK